MKHLYQTQEVLESWRRCIEKGVIRTATSPAICFEKNIEAAKIKKNILVPIFEECLEKIKNYINEEYLFLLVDCDGILLKKK